VIVDYSFNLKSNNKKNKIPSTPFEEHADGSSFQCLFDIL
jgi:hypothetical protein